MLSDIAAFDGIDFQIHRQISDGNVVVNERTDTMRRKDGGAIPLPVMGVFLVLQKYYVEGIMVGSVK